jgi:AmiR/NasT family two-component response regulator
MLEQRLRELEEEIAERKLTGQAKAVLQSTYNMSEEQAHLHLRTISRKSRKPLKEVAQELIDARNSLWLNPL